MKKIKQLKTKITNLFRIAGKIANKMWFEYFVLLLILAGAFGVRLYKINNPLGDWHAWRQADTASVSRIYLDKGIDLLHPQYYDLSPTQTGNYNPEGMRFVEFPIFNLLNVWAYKLVPRFSLEVWGRLISIICSIGTSFFLYLIGKRLINKWGGLSAAFFYSFIPFNIYFTRVILPEPMAVFFIISSIWFFIVYIDKESRTGLFLSAVLFALGMLLKPFILFYIPIYIYLYLKKFGYKKIFKKLDLLLAIDLALMPFFLWRIWENKFPIGIPAFNWLFNDDGIRFRPAFWRWIFGERLGYLILGVWGLFPFVFGILRKKNWPIVLTLLGMFLYVSILATGNVRHDYYQTLIIPAVSLVLASGVVGIWNSSELNKLLMKGFLIFSIVMMLGMGWYQVKGNYQVNHYEIVAAGMKADEILPKDAIVIAPYNGDTTFLYQTHRFGWPVVDRSFDELIKTGADYYVSVNYDNDTNQLLNKYKALEKNGTFVIIDLHQQIK